MQQKEKTAAIASKKIYPEQFQDSKQVRIWKTVNLQSK